jgi:hypothetical protein
MQAQRVFNKAAYARRVVEQIDKIKIIANK